MAKTIDLASDSTSVLKKGDTTFTMKWVCGNDNLPVDLSDATNITVKLINTTDQGELQSLATSVDLTVSDQENLIDGIVSVKFDSDLMNKLNAGWYTCEIVVTDPNGTAIYPTESYMLFQILPNPSETLPNAN